MSINNTGYWNVKNPKDIHSYDKNLSIALLEFFKNENVKTNADLGCGLGDYVNHFKNNNLNSRGFDGNPNTPLLTDNLCEVLDLSIPKVFL